MYGENIKIQDCEIYKNKTRKYLVPILKNYGNIFAIKYLNLQHKIAYGINDMIAIKSNHVFENCIFMLVKPCNTFVSFLSWIKTQDYYMYDYVYDSILFGKYHMIVLEFPFKFQDSYKRFLEGKYSQMFPLETIQNFFSVDTTIKVLTQNVDYKEEFKKQIQQEFNYFDYIPERCLIELDLPYAKKQEIFNYYLK